MKKTAVPLVFTKEMLDEQKERFKEIEPVVFSGFIQKHFYDLEHKQEYRDLFIPLLHLFQESLLNGVAFEDVYDAVKALRAIQDNIANSCYMGAVKDEWYFAEIMNELTTPWKTNLDNYTYEHMDGLTRITK